MAKQRRGDDLQTLEGAGAGGAGVGGTKWSSMPSFKGNSSTMDDLRKIGSDSSHLKGAAKQAKDESINRAFDRTAVRAVGAGTAATATKEVADRAIGEAKASNSSKDEDGFPTAIKALREVDKEKEGSKYAKPDAFSKGGMTASKRADGCAQRGKTKGTIVMCGGGMSK
jgi:hypothetical protein